MQDDRTNYATSYNKGNIDAEQDFVRAIDKDRYPMNHSLGKALESGMKKIDDIARCRYHHQPSITLLVPSLNP